MNTVSKEILVRYLNCETTLAEEKAIMAWLEEDERHRKELDDLDFVFGSSLMSKRVRVEKKSFLATTAGRFATVAASVLLVLGLSLLAGSAYSNHKFAKCANQSVELAVPVGQRINMVLTDGTKVTLNSGAKITYPAIFNGDFRKVRVCGEAMFEVAHDAEHPFIVDTYAGTVEALGTKFSVKAYEESSLFSTALLEGSVRVSGAGEQVILNPGEMAKVSGGRLVKGLIDNKEDFLWTDGIISLSGKSFEDIMKNYEIAYGFNIIYRSDSIPQIRCNGKIRIADGIEHAIAVLKKGGTEFNYEVNYNLNEVYIW